MLSSAPDPWVELVTDPRQWPDDGVVGVDADAMGSSAATWIQRFAAARPDAFVVVLLGDETWPIDDPMIRESSHAYITNHSRWIQDAVRLWRLREDL